MNTKSKLTVWLPIDNIAVMAFVALFLWLKIPILTSIVEWIYSFAIWITALFTIGYGLVVFIGSQSVLISLLTPVKISVDFSKKLYHYIKVGLFLILSYFVGLPTFCIVIVMFIVAKITNKILVTKISAEH